MQSCFCLCMTVLKVLRGLFTFPRLELHIRVELLVLHYGDSYITCLILLAKIKLQAQVQTSHTCDVIGWNFWVITCDD